jgi:hypothetical protein
VAAAEWLSYLRGLFHHWHTDKVAEHIERIDQRNREVRHDLNNIQARTDALARLVESMREEEYTQCNSGNGKRTPPLS